MAQRAKRPRSKRKRSRSKRSRRNRYFCGISLEDWNPEQRSGEDLYRTFVSGQKFRSIVGDDGEPFLSRVNNRTIEMVLDEAARAGSFIVRTVVDKNGYHAVIGLQDFYFFTDGPTVLGWPRLFVDYALESHENLDASIDFLADNCLFPSKTIHYLIFELSMWIDDGKHRNRAREFD